MGFVNLLLILLAFCLIAFAVRVQYHTQEYGLLGWLLLGYFLLIVLYIGSLIVKQRND